MPPTATKGMTYMPSLRAEQAYQRHLDTLERKQSADVSPSLDDESRKGWWGLAYDIIDHSQREGREDALAYAGEVTSDYPELSAG
mgnify:FL=1